MNLLIVGNDSDFHIGHYFRRAAEKMGFHVHISDTREAYDGSWMWQKINWHAFGRRPARMSAFERKVLLCCERFKSGVLLATGIVPLSEKTLRRIQSLGVRTANFLTDDPWNPAHRAAWFFRALTHYDNVFTPRRSNEADLKRIGCARVSYIPFAYSPEVHFPELPMDESEREDRQCDVLFIGGADRDRAPFLRALIAAGLKVHTYGGYWRRYGLAAHCRGMADLRTQRVATRCARLTLCLVRRSNRDGHTMRSFEAPAMGGCLLMEKTKEHLEIFGNDREAVVYFDQCDDLVAKSWSLLRDGEARKRLSAASHSLITRGKNTYVDRLQMIVEAVRG